ncbi:hypothetical protein MPH_02245 [Macrophomina phaseolina MS6]|uniref:Uncharacterized protein n=1 Tax=Macrophomina phaseolina (strain MS6) TaxID=1126212 RepID=K2SUU7_MACPH|nr:hypothetical protein MPH_02245 [Macrophomina phaseolina MS6]
MDTDAKGQVGGIDSTEAARKKMASESGAYRCASCAKTNAEIMREREELAKEAEAEEGKRKEEEVPEELRLAYREDLAKEEGAQAESSGASAAKSATTSAQQGAEQSTPAETPSSPSGTPAAAAQAAPPSPAPGAPAVPAPTRTIPAPPTLRQQQRPMDDGVPTWIDKAIYGVLGALAFMILRKFF